MIEPFIDWIILMARGLLLINLGTPNSTDHAAVRRYLREFLVDKRVIDLPAPIRYLLVYAFILPFRTKRTAHAYQEIWTPQGSPLLINSLNAMKQLTHYLDPDYKIALGMRYGQPSIEQALQSLKDCSTLTILPLYPQYSSAATGSALEHTLDRIKAQEVIPNVRIISEFYQHPAYLKAQTDLISTHLNEQDHLVFSYHGIPERQILKTGCHTVCKDICPSISKLNHNCYKAQCHQTSRLIAERLGLNSDQYSSSFQSRLGKTPWIKPYTDELFTSLAARGIKRVAVVCPSFVTDCLETIEEIGIRAQAQWQQLGGTGFKLIPCLNDHPAWLSAIKEIIA